MDEEYLKVYSKCTEGERGRAGSWCCCRVPDACSRNRVALPLLQLQCQNRASDRLRPSPWLAAEAQKLAQQFSNTEFISKLLPESGVLEALKKVVPMALKLVV